jgi:hypothetical protein
MIDTSISAGVVVAELKALHTTRERGLAAWCLQLEDARRRAVIRGSAFPRALGQEAWASTDNCTPRLLFFLFSTSEAYREASSACSICSHSCHGYCHPRQILFRSPVAKV